MNSILNSIKKMLGLASDYDAFDDDIITFINSTFMILRQLGVGPKEGFAISGSDEVWTDYIPSGVELYGVKSYIYAKVRMIFDPPQNGNVKEALQAVIDEMEWRLNCEVDPRTTFE